MLHQLSAAGSRPVESTTIRVASVPSAHVYVRHLSPPRVAGDGVRRLPDPAVRRDATQSGWWPPEMLQASWVREHDDEFDVFHVHFGFDARTPAELTELVATLREHRKPLVLTVHDLRNPHHLAPDEHDAQLDVLVPAAQRLITLTPGAAAQIERRWGRRAVVVPHPHIVDLDRMEQLQCSRRDGGGPLRIGLHLKSLRASMDPWAVVPALVRAVGELDDAVLQVDAHREILCPGGTRYDERLADLLRSYDDSIDLRVHDFFDDEQLWAYLSSLDVSVLPYRFGTHSGWLEACRDVGTSVVAPTCGYYGEQGPVETYVLDEDHFDEASLVAAVHRAAAAPPVVPTVAERERQRHEVALAHRSLYESLVA